MIGFYILNLVCLAALLLLTYTNTLWARLSLLSMVVGVALGWFSSGEYGLVVFAAACAFTAYASFKMNATPFDQKVVSGIAILMTLSILVRLLHLTLVTAFLFIMWIPWGASMGILFNQIRIQKGPTDQTGILLILWFESLSQAVQVFKLIPIE